MKQTVSQERQCGHGDQADPPVQGEHDGEHSEDRQEMRGELQNRFGEDFLQGVGVASDLGQQVARPRPVVEGEGQSLQMGEELPAQRINHLVTDRRGDEDLKVRE